MSAVMTSRETVIARAVPPMKRRMPGILLGVLSDGSAVGLLALSMWLIVRAGEQPPVLHLTFAIVGVRALAVGRAAFRYVERLSSHDSALRQLAVLRTETFEQLIPRVPGALETSKRGEVLSAFVDDVDQLQDEALRVRQPKIVSGIVIGLSLVMVAIASIPAALILLAVLVVSGFVAAWLARRIAGKSDRELAAARSGLMDALLERFASAEVLAAFDALPAQRARIAAAEARLAKVQERRARSAGLTGAIVTLGAGIATLAIFLIAAPVTGVAMSAPVFAAIVIAPAAVFEVYAQVLAAFTARRAVESSADRIADLTEQPLPAEIPVDPAAPVSLPTVLPAGEALLTARDLSVRHAGADHDAVTGINFELAAGELLVVTGPSGSGKSTLALALTRLLDYRGEYRVAGVDARTLAGAELRSFVGLCEQSPHLFDSDIRQNLKFAQESASDDELVAVLERVGLGQWLAERGGLDARVGEHGALVSGGQAQRIALARAILADFPVVILDEPTAGVDRERADVLMRDLLGAIPGDRAVMLITHTHLPDDVTGARLEL
ncbi:thiol reductant ABC exporter subunit CydC [Leucobacter sp. 1207-22]|uniref:thiol reductant ABC exporter subunit CydC n=1 Tax=Leucobacter sp. 1207-22 TaxID=2604456 RepID=UPI004063FC38